MRPLLAPAGAFVIAATAVIMPASALESGFGQDDSFEAHIASLEANDRAQDALILKLTRRLNALENSGGIGSGSGSGGSSGGGGTTGGGGSTGGGGTSGGGGASGGGASGGGGTLGGGGNSGGGNPGGGGSAGGGGTIGGGSTGELPQDLPASYAPASPATPTGPTIGLGSGSYTLQSDTTYLLTEDAGVLTIPMGASRITIEGQGYACAGVNFPAQWASSPEPKCSDIVVRDMRLIGGQGGLEVYGQRILIESVTALAEDTPRYGLYSWGARDLTVRDSYLHSQGNEAATRFVNCSRVAMYRCDVGTPSKHSMRIHGNSERIWFSDNTTSSPWFLGYQNRPQSEDIRGLIVRRCTYVGPSITGNNSWFQHAQAGDLTDFTFENNVGPGTALSASNLSGLEAAASSSWSISGNAR